MKKFMSTMEWWSCVLHSFLVLLVGAVRSNKAHHGCGWFTATRTIGIKGFRGLWWAANNPIYSYIGSVDENGEFVVFNHSWKKGDQRVMLNQNPMSVHNYESWIGYGEVLYPNYYTIVYTPYGNLPFPWFSGWIKYNWYQDWYFADLRRRADAAARAVEADRPKGFSRFSR